KRGARPGGWKYVCFCPTSRPGASQLDLVMRQPHRGGEKLFVDYAGQGIAIVNRHSGEVHEAAIFVAVLGASSYTYAEATWTQSLPDWIGSHLRTFSGLGRGPQTGLPPQPPTAVP